MIKCRKRKERYNLKRCIKLQATIRCKILAVIGWIFNIDIECPEFEDKARLKREKRCRNGKSRSNN